MRTLVVFIAILVLVAVPITALHAQSQPSDPVIELVAPPQDSVINGSHVSVQVRFRSSEFQQVTKIEVYLDGKYITNRIYENARQEGETSFNWDTNRTANGMHKLDVRAFAGEEYLGSASGDVYVSNKPADLAPPRVAVMSPKDGAVVSGVISVVVQASDNSGIEPMVNVVVDNNLRAVRNHSPYEYSWDTTKVSNGPHTIDVSAEDDSRNPASVKTIHVTVHNTITSAPVMINAYSGSTTPAASGKSTTESARTSTPSEQSFEVRNPAPAETAKPSASVSVAKAPVDEVKASSPEPAAKVLGAKVEMGVPEQTLVAKAEPQTAALECCPGSVCVASKPTEKLYESPVSSPCPIADVHTVKHGDNLYTIARKYGVTVDAIARINSIADPSKLSLGMKLRIPAATKMIAVRPVFEAAGGSLTWESGRKAVHAVAPSHNVLLRIGSVKALVDASQVVMDKAAVVTGGRTMVPENFVTNQLGMSK